MSVKLHVMDPRGVIGTVEVTGTLKAAWKKVLDVMNKSIKNYPCNTGDSFKSEWRWAERDIKKARKLTTIDRDVITGFHPFIFGVVWHECF